MHKSFFNSEAMKSIRASLICILIGLLVGYLVLALINAGGSTRAIWTILLNFMSRASAPARLKALGNTLTKTAPLLMCALSICFCYKVGLFNIGAAGQYEAGALLCMRRWSGSCPGMYVWFWPLWPARCSALSAVS